MWIGGCVLVEFWEAVFPSMLEVEYALEGSGGVVVDWEGVLVFSGSEAV